MPAHRFDELLGVHEVVPREHDHGQLRRRRWRAAPRRWGHRGTGTHPVQHLRELVRATLPVEVALHHLEAVGRQTRRERGVVQQAAHGGGHPRRVSRRYDERGLAVDRVLPTSAVVGRDERRAAGQGFETGLAKALEPTPDREDPRRRVFAPERLLIEVLACVPFHRHSE